MRVRVICIAMCCDKGGHILERRSVNTLIYHLVHPFGLDWVVEAEDGAQVRSGLTIS